MSATASSRRTHPGAARWSLGKRLAFVALCALLGAMAGRAGSARSLSVTASADTYLEAGAPTANHGSEPTLQLDQWADKQMLLRFPLVQVRPERRVLRATLRLFLAQVGPNEAEGDPPLKTCLALYDVLTPWTEVGATFVTADGHTPWYQGPGMAEAAYDDVGPLPQPDYGQRLSVPLLPFDPGSVSEGKWLEIDVTPFVRTCLRGHLPEANLLLRGSVLSRDYIFPSREAPDPAKRPNLALQLSDAAGDFRLEGDFLTDWHAGRQVAVRIIGEKSASLGRRWALEAKPATSKARDRDLHDTGEGAAFVPDVPGVYRIRLTVPTGQGQLRWTSEAVDVYVLSVPAHPRLYVNAARLATLRQQAAEHARLAAAFAARVQQGSAGIADGSYQEFGAWEGCEDSALMYLLTRDPHYAASSVRYAQFLLAKPLPQHFSDSHEATFAGAEWVHAMALHYDWCYDQLAAEYRQRVAAWLKEAALWIDARSGRPIAHNDGGARQLSLLMPALALLGDDSEAPGLLRRAHGNFEHNLLPWLNDGGRGGRSGDGGEYEGLHGFFLVRSAWAMKAATGEDTFEESPFFANRLKHLLFGWYPRQLYSPNGTRAIRQYYSPGGDHLRLGFSGDTQPYESAAVLADHYRGTASARNVRWLVGEWPTFWAQHFLKWGLLADWESIEPAPPAGLSYLDEGFDTVYLRSDWSDDATWIVLENGPWVSIHQNLDKGGFEIFKGDVLAARTGCMDEASVTTPHTLNYLHRTISTNGLLINDPEERWRGFLGGRPGDSDGGGERSNWPLPSTPDAQTYLTYRPVYQRGHITRFADTGQVAYACADLTDAYNSPGFHGGTLNRPKVTAVTRELLYLRPLDTVVVLDRVASTDPSFKKTWLLHSLGDLEVLAGTETRVDDGEFHYRGATRALLRAGWPKPVPSFGRLLSVTLLPEAPRSAKIGGRVDLPEGQVEGSAGDPQHRPHRHHHLKDFWVNGTNYPPRNPPEVRWFGDPAKGECLPGTPDESGGRGRWRLEVSPSVPSKDDRFLHVLCPRLGSEGPFPQIERLTSQAFDGALVREAGMAAAVLFPRRARSVADAAFVLPPGHWLLVLAGLRPGAYEVSGPDTPVRRHEVGAEGIMTAPVTGGRLAVSRVP